jgi:hypothetical protein
VLPDCRCHSLKQLLGHERQNPLSWTAIKWKNKIN